MPSRPSAGSREAARHPPPWLACPPAATTLAAEPGAPINSSSSGATRTMVTVLGTCTASSASGEAMQVTTAASVRASSSTDPRPLGVVEGPRDDGRRDRAGADALGEVAVDRAEPAEPDRVAEGGGHRARGHTADDPLARVHGRAPLRRRVGAEADELALDGERGHALDRKST